MEDVVGKGFENKKSEVAGISEKTSPPPQKSKKGDQAKSLRIDCLIHPYFHGL
jgi:hypothetical protein